MYAPIVLFVYKRLDKLKQVVTALLLNPEAKDSELIVYSDSYKDNSDRADVESVRKYLTSLSDFKKITIRLRDKNYGLSQNIIQGLNEVFLDSEQAIVIEDDIVVSPNFLKYMNANLSFYKDEIRVASIHGYCYECKIKLPNYFFLRGADCWGWATWKRSWMLFESDGSKLFDQISMRLKIKFNYYGGYNFSKMLQMQIVGKNDSWAIRWHASMFIKDMLTLYPGESLVHNIGNDGSGTHSKKSNKYDVNFNRPTQCPHVIKITESQYAYWVYVYFFWQKKIEDGIKLYFPFIGKT